MYDFIFPITAATLPLKSLDNSFAYWSLPNFHVPKPLHVLPRKLQDIYNQVMDSGQYNFQAAKIPIESGLNIPAWRRWAEKTELPDKDLCDQLDCGFPAGYTGPEPSTVSENHKSANEFAAEVDTYIQTEIRHKAMLGPFQSPPFDVCQVSPVMTKDKPRSTKKRTILDLSWPPRNSINDFIDTKCYLGEDISFTLPQADNLVHLITQAGPNCYLFSHDLSRAYRQLRNCPSSFPLLCIKWRGYWLIDGAPPFGLRSSASFCQRTTNAVCHFMKSLNHDILSYIDDLAGCKRTFTQAVGAQHTLSTLFLDLGLEEAAEKSTPPSTDMVWIGTRFNTVEQTMSIPQYKLQDIKKVVSKYTDASYISRHDLQSVVGKCVHVAQLSKPARLFINNLLHDLNSTPTHGYCTLSEGSREDLKWFRDTLPTYNGVHMYNPPPLPSHLQVNIDVQASHCVASCDNQWFKYRPPVQLSSDQMLAATTNLALLRWRDVLAHHTVNIFIPTGPALDALQTSRTPDRKLQKISRNVWKTAALNDLNLCFHRALIQPQVRCVGSRLPIPDALWDQTF